MWKKSVCDLTFPIKSFGSLGFNKSRALPKFDLRKSYIIDREFLHSGGIDHNYALDDQSMEAPVAKIYSNKTKMGVEYFTNQQGIQFYTGNMMLNNYVGKYDRSYGLQHGMCLEPQHFPDAINHSNFPSPILRKNKNYSL